MAAAEEIQEILLLESEERYKIAQSFAYFLDEYVWIEDKATNQPIKLTLWPDQRKVIPDVLDNRLLVILKAHQLGYTWLFVAGYALWLSITKKMHQVVINSFNEDAGKEIITRVNFIRNRLPGYLLPEVGADTTLSMEFLHKDDNDVVAPSTIQVIPATEKGGQSKTPNVMVFDESCWNRYVDKAYNGSLPGITQAKGKIIIISNAIKTAPGWPFTREIYTGSMKGENDFKRIFLPWWSNPTRSRKVIPDMVDDHDKPMTEFKRAMLRSGGIDGGMMHEDDFSQRYPESEDEAISSLTGSYFGRSLSTHTDTFKGDVGNLELVNGEIVFKPDPRGLLEIWRYPYHTHKNQGHWTRRYAIGSDVSEGLGESYSVAHILDRHLQDIIARLRSNRTDAHTWANMLYLLSKYYHHALDVNTAQNALLCVETTGPGQTTVRRLEELSGSNLYMQQAAPRAGSETTMRFGWHESEQAKHDMSEGLRTWFKTTKGTVYDQILIDECSTWIQYEGTRRIGRSRASSVIAWYLQA